MTAWVYMMTNRRNGTLYIGVTTDLARRAVQHRAGQIEGFTKRYGLKMLVYAEPHPSLPEAIWREKALKAWQRDWKLRLIESQNPEWADLFETL
jgi:putative endonuclease